MSNQEQFVNVSHSDKTHSKGETFASDQSKAKANLDDHHPDYPMNDTLATGIAMILKAERSRRHGHYYRYLAPFNADTTDRVLTGDQDPVEESLLELTSRIDQMTPEQVEFARTLGGKGVSAELGHVDQFGDWSAATPLDESIRRLPQSERLQDAGFVFTNTYEDKRQAKRSYRIHMNGHHGDNDSDGPKGSVLKAVRRRAAADLVTPSGESIEIIKHSTFLLHSAQLGRKYLELLETIMTLSANRETAKEAIPLMGEAGELIVEPFITHEELREVSTGVLAVSSLYFALQRAK